MNIFDIHAHIYPEAIADRAAEGISAAYDGFPVPNRGVPQVLRARMDEAGVTRTCVHSVATKPKQVTSINRFILQTAQEDPAFVPFAAIHPDCDALEDEVERIVAAGFRGVKVHPEMQGFVADEPRAMRMYDLLRGRLPVLIHCGDYRTDGSSPERMRTVSRAFPDLTLICAHFGGWTRWAESAEILRSEHVFTDCSSSFYALPDDMITGIIRKYSSSRVLYGTDYPMFTQKTEIERLLSLPLTDREKEDILWNTHLSIDTLSDL